MFWPWSTTTVIPYSGCVPANAIVPAAGARMDVPFSARMSSPLWNSGADGLGEALELVPRRQAPRHAIGRNRAAADSPVAAARLELGAERLPDARMELPPSAHLLT